jgi:hypothetical protein
LDIIDYAHSGVYASVNFEVLVETSGKIRSTAKKTAKIALIAGILRQARGKEISLASEADTIKTVWSIFEAQRQAG